MTLCCCVGRRGSKVSDCDLCVVRFALSIIERRMIYAMKSGLWPVGRMFGFFFDGKR